MADPNYESLTPEQRAVVDAAIEWQAAEANFIAPEGNREADPGGGNKNVRAENRVRSAAVALRHAVRAYNLL